jgi:hypothetical protein
LHDTEASLQFIPQIDPPPAHHPMSGWIGTSLNQPDQFSLLLCCEFWFSTEGLQIVQSAQAVGVIAMYPVPQSLTIHAAGLGRRLAIRPVEHHGKSQHTPRRRAVLLPPSRRSKFGRRQINPGNANRPAHRFCSTLVNRHRVRISPIWES